MRIRWDNLAMLLAALAVVGGVATTIWSQLNQASPAQKAPATYVPLEKETPKADPALNTVTSDQLSQEEINSLVVEAKDFIAQGRWDEAQDRLDSIDPTVAESSGANAVKAQLTKARATWTTLDEQLRRQIDAKQWNQAQGTLDKLQQISPLNDDQIVLRDQITEALTPVTPTTTPEKPLAETAVTKKTTTPLTTAKPAVSTQSASTTPTTTPAPAAQSNASTGNVAATAGVDTTKVEALLNQVINGSLSDASSINLEAPANSK